MVIISYKQGHTYRGCLCNCNGATGEGGARGCDFHRDCNVGKQARVIVEYS